MIQFFRKIRQQLLNQNKVSKYLVYAIGEIVLVVIGILIAIQINNWNLDNKNKVLERDLLAGIQLDLVSDTTQINSRFYPSFNDLKNSIVLFDSVLSLKNSEIDILYLDSIFARCIRQRNTFWPTSGTYRTIVNNGTSNIFGNQQLYKGVQKINDHTIELTIAAGTRIDDLSDTNRRKFNYVYALGSSEKIKFYRNSNTRNEIDFWFKELAHFESLMKFFKKSAKQILVEIENELAK